MFYHPPTLEDLKVCPICNRPTTQEDKEVKIFHCWEDHLGPHSNWTGVYFKHSLIKMEFQLQVDWCPELIKIRQWYDDNSTFLFKLETKNVFLVETKNVFLVLPALLIIDWKDLSKVRRKIDIYRTFS
jgi:hypothetical protein